MFCRRVPDGSSHWEGIRQGNTCAGDGGEVAAALAGGIATAGVASVAGHIDCCPSGASDGPSAGVVGVGHLGAGATVG